NFSTNAEHISAGDRHDGQQGLLSHPEIAVLVVRRDAAFVTEGDLHLVPREVAAHVGHGRVDFARSVAAGETQAKEAAFGDGGAGTLHNIVGSVPGEIDEVECLVVHGLHETAGE